MSETTTLSGNETTSSVLNLKFISHGTLETADFDRARRFYTEFMGFEVVRASTMSLMIRCGGNHVYVVVPKEAGRPPMSVRNHNGADVLGDAEVDAAYQAVVEHADTWGLKKISKPVVQHGTYSFYFWDFDDNSWEILSNPRGGYAWMFERGDQQGKGSQDKTFGRPEITAP